MMINVHELFLLIMMISNIFSKERIMRVTMMNLTSQDGTKQRKSEQLGTIKRGRIGHSLTFLVMKRHELPLEEKIQLIKDNNGGLGMSVRKLAEKYCSKHFISS